MRRLISLRTGVLITVVAFLSMAVGLAPTGAAGGTSSNTVVVELRIWQNVDDAEDIWVSARPAGGDWNELGTLPLEFERPEGSLLAPDNWFYWRYGTGSIAIADVLLAVSQDLERPDLLYASACSYPPDCGLILVALDGGYSRSGAYRYGDTTLAVPTPPKPPAERERLLLEDRDNLLALRDRLAGRERTLNWHPDLPIEKWTGVTIGGSPPRVTKLILPDSDLRGGLSGLLGNLTGLRELQLDGNSLDGLIPSKLVQVDLTHLYLGGNGLEGCVPPPLRALPNHDLDSLGLPPCPPLRDISFEHHVLVQGTYRLGDVVFDVPAGVALDSHGYALNELGPHFYILSEVEPGTQVWIGSTGRDVVTHLRTTEGQFESIRESAWRASDEVLSRWPESAEDGASGTTQTPATTSRLAPSLTVVSDGAPDALILEWVGGPADVVRWQYREGVGEGKNRRWSDWLDVPNSDSSTRSFRVEGLQRGQHYVYQVRAVEELDGLPSALKRGITQSADGIPSFAPGQVVLGDGVTEWRFPNSDYVATIPEGVRARTWGPGTIALVGMFGETRMDFDQETGEMRSRYSIGEPPEGATVLLEQIVASIRKLPAP